MKALDLTKKQFGYLTAIEKAPKQNDKYTRWICKCKCGNTTIVRTDYLTSGHTTSCGCIKALHFKSKAKELINQQIGKLKVIKYDDIKGSYLCECECGNTTYVLGYNLTNGNTNSCGCLKSKGEYKINEILTKMGVSYKTQYSFKDCRFPDSQKLAYFDYAIFKGDKLIALIEYDGIQHEIGWGKSEESLQKIQAHDKFKEYYCLLNNISLIRINYRDESKLNEEYINNLLSFYLEDN